MTQELQNNSERYQLLDVLFVVDYISQAYIFFFIFMSI